MALSMASSMLEKAKEAGATLPKIVLITEQDRYYNALTSSGFKVVDERDGSTYSVGPESLEVVRGAAEYKEKYGVDGNSSFLSFFLSFLSSFFVLQQSRPTHAHFSSSCSSSSSSSTSTSSPSYNSFPLERHAPDGGGHHANGSENRALGNGRRRELDGADCGQWYSFHYHA